MQMGIKKIPFPSKHLSYGAVTETPEPVPSVLGKGTGGPLHCKMNMWIGRLLEGCIFGPKAISMLQAISRPRLNLQSQMKLM